MQKEKAHILVSDDEPYMRRQLRSVLEAEGHQVTEARDGLECFCLVRKNDFDVVFSDIRTPRMDGIEVLERIMSLGTSTQIIMCSALGNHGNVDRCIEMGAVAFLDKPVDLNKLLAALNLALAIRKEKK